jgi:Fe-S cluster assembly protein SufD
MPDGSGAMHPFTDLVRSAIADGAPDGWLAVLRRDAAARYEAAGLPGRRDEYWRYTNLNALAGADWTLAGPVATERAAALVDTALAGLDGHRVVLVNGAFQPDLCDLDSLPEGARVASLAELLAHEPQHVERWLGRIVAGEGQPLATLNTALIGDGMVLLVEPGVTIERPILLVSVGVAEGRPVTFQPRNLVVLGDGAAATLLEAHVGEAGEVGYFAKIVGEVALGEAARLGHYVLQDAASAALHLALTEVTLGAGAAYDGFVLQTGARLGRHESRATLEGGDIACTLAGIYLARDGQLLDNTTLVDHVAPACRSRQHFKGVLDGRSRGVFQGKIHVRRDAQQTDGHQLSRALLLSPRAEIDTRPELEIYADDVKCSHGATAGDLDEDTLFYLLSRGIARDTARRLLVGAFAAEVLDEIGDRAIRDWFSTRIDGWLDAHIGALPDIGDDA